MNGTSQRELDLAREAVEWLDRLADDGAANAAFAKWVTASPLHVQAILNATSVERLLDHIDEDRRIQVEELLEAASTDVVSLRTTPEVKTGAAPPSLTRSREVRVARWAASIGAIALLAVFAVWWLWPLGRETYATRVGEQRTVELSDGSTVLLNARSEVSVRFTDTGRDLFLEGEATFKAHKDPLRPFRVHSGDTVVRAIGTQFNVHQRPSGTVVSVIEGVVEISGSLGRSGEPGAPLTATALLAPRLNAGEEARVGMDGHVVKRAVSDVAKLAAWQAPRLVFEDERLDDIAAEFNRWNRIQIEIREQEIAARLYSGAFNADDPDSLIAFLARDPGLDVRRSKERVVVARRRVQ